ncbi:MULTISPECIES: tyrosine-type recombinase/integrase [Flavobacteriaceae]|uniref:tyrosine-type recombinase/integrase n=1 Tax=Flavobacteriaceae TaxID=49546 RepID=UPI0014927F85|nr:MULTISPECIES: tyrosine-type recombinase/integrase [Allomuricauda]MDC6364822.1 tyrosine-type recombinase/integrase [Muricauda sp. AC10]
MIGSTYIEFDKATTKGKSLIRTGENPTFGLLIICGINLGLRISDLLQLTFKQLNSDAITIVEKKTGKTRVLQVNDNIKEVLKYFEDEVNYGLGGHCFVSQKGSVYSTQQVNRLIQKHFKGNVSSHSLRKSFGRRVWENHNESDKALLYLSEIFNHTSPSVTRKYLGIRAEELADVYLSL